MGLLYKHWRKSDPISHYVITKTINKGLKTVFFYNFVYFFGWAGSLLLHRLFSGCSKWRLLCSCGAEASHCDGFSCCRAWAPGHEGFSSFGSWALEHTLNSWGPQAYLLCGMWDLPRSEIEPMSPALADWFFNNETPEKPQDFC